MNTETGEPLLSNKIGGLSGRPIKPIAIRTVYEISKNVGIPVIGCGGIYTSEDAVEFLLAGASAVQMCSAVVRNSYVAPYIRPEIFNQVNRGIKHYLKIKGFKSVVDIAGMAHKY